MTAGTGTKLQGVWEIAVQAKISFTQQNTQLTIGLLNYLNLDAGNRG